MNHAAPENSAKPSPAYVAVTELRQQPSSLWEHLRPARLMVDLRTLSPQSKTLIFRTWVEHILPVPHGQFKDISGQYVLNLSHAGPFGQVSLKLSVKALATLSPKPASRQAPRCCTLEKDYPESPISLTQVYVSRDRVQGLGFGFSV